MGGLRFVIGIPFSQGQSFLEIKELYQLYM